MRILIAGITGMLGHQLVKELAPLHTVAGTSRGAIPAVLQDFSFTHYNAEASDLSSFEKAIADFKPDAVVNCIGVIKQKKEVKDESPTLAINGEFPHRLYAICRKHGARLLHMSTDCVFSGTKGVPYTEQDKPDPIDLYGRSKLLGEVVGEGAVTLRTSIIGRELGTQVSLLEWAISQKGKTIKGYANALYTGFTTYEMARIIRRVLEKHKDLSGLYQVASSPISKYDLLKLANTVMVLDLTIEKEEEFHMDRRLSGSLFNKTTGYTPPSWTQMIEEIA